jgi:poly(hydroxyalkanoate) depolymerase family esterase
MPLAKTIRSAAARLYAGDLRGAVRLFRMDRPRPSNEPEPSPTTQPQPDAAADPAIRLPQTPRAEAGPAEPRPAAPPPAAPTPTPTAATRRAERMRRPLGDVLRLLEHGKASMGWPVSRSSQPRALPQVPPGARFESRHHATAAGGRDYRLYVPASAAEGLRGLVVMLHGCKQDPDDFAVGTGMNLHAERARLVVAYPRQASGANAMQCWNWFNPADQQRDGGEPAIIAGITGALQVEFGLEDHPVMVAGLSAGGAMAAVMGTTYPELYTAVGIHSGLPYGAANDAASALAAMRGEKGLAPAPGPAIPTIVFHGDADRTVHPGNATRIAAAVGPGDTRRETGTSAGGRAVRRDVLSDDTGRVHLEMWMIAGAGHAWSGGDPQGSYTDPAGPDASAEMVRFMLEGAMGGALSGSLDGAHAETGPRPPAGRASAGMAGPHGDAIAARR